MLVSSVFITGLPFYLYTTQIFPPEEDGILKKIYFYMGAIIAAISFINYGYTQYIDNLIRLTHSLTNSLTHSLTHSLTYSRTHLLTHSLNLIQIEYYQFTRVH